LPIFVNDITLFLRWDYYRCIEDEQKALGLTIIQRGRRLRPCVSKLITRDYGKKREAISFRVETIIPYYEVRRRKDKPSFWDRGPEGRNRLGYKWEYFKGYKFKQ
jgi:hypothetical protein